MYCNSSVRTAEALIAGAMMMTLPVIAAGAENGAESNLIVNQTEVGAQGVESQGDALVRKGNELLLDRQYMAARDCYIEAKQRFMRFNTDVFRSKIEACDRLIARCYSDMADEAMAKADERELIQDFETAIELCSEALRYCPEQADMLQSKIEMYKKRQRAAQTKQEYSVEKLVPEQAASDYQIQILLEQGRKLMLHGEYMAALGKFQEVLLIDPYNADAVKCVQAANVKIGKIGKLRADNAHRKMASEVEWKQTVPIIPAGGAAAGENFIGDEPAVRQEVSHISELERKMRSIILPLVDCENTEVDEVIQNLRDQALQYDPDRVGVNIVLKHYIPTKDERLREIERRREAERNAQNVDIDADADYEEETAAVPGKEDINAPVRIDLLLTNKSLMEAIIVLCQKGGLKYRIDDYAVVIAPENVPLDNLITKVYPVGSDVADGIGADWKTFLEGNGVDFPQGANVFYERSISRLYVKNTIDNQRIVENIINNEINPQPMVQIMLKLLDIAQNDLDELAFNWQLAVNQNDPDARFAMAENSSQLMRYYVNEESSGDDVTMMDVATLGFQYTNEKDGTTFKAAMFALDRADGKDVLSLPRVLTRSDQNAVIEMVTERFFPDEWETVELTANSSDATVQGWIPTELPPQPTFDEAKKVGITFTILPRVKEANEETNEPATITAKVSFPIVTFAGWMIYDSRSEGGEGGNEGEYEKMPMFNKRQIDTTVTLVDGQTAVIGGLAADTVTNINDKVPILCDIPIVGRLFQSRYTKSEKRSLLIFMTCRVVKPDGSAKYPDRIQNTGVPAFGKSL